MVNEWSAEKMRKFDITIQEDLADKKAYECLPVEHGVLKGTNSLICGDRLIMGGDRSYLYISLSLMTIPTFCFIVPAVTGGGSYPYLAIPPFLMWLVMLFSFFMAACIDPGIIPRELNPIDTNPEIVLIKDQVMYRWCRTCYIYRPPRAKHCPVCDNCVDRFDHHCPWVGTCIGRRNYRYFFTFVNTTFLHAACVFAFSVIMLDKYDSIADSLKHGYLLVFALAISFIALPLVGSLAGYHIYLVVSNQTTNEDLNEVYAKDPNPFTMGCVENATTILCAPQRPSRIMHTSQKPLIAWTRPPIVPASSNHIATQIMEDF